MEAILFFVGGACAVASLLLAWRVTGAMLHVYMILRKLGYQKTNTLLWDHEFDEVTPQKMRDIVVLYEWNRTLAELLCCPVCFSFHLALWVSIAFVLLGSLPLAYIAYGTLAFPIIANKLAK